MSLREASAKLGINYSTAKTIVQTFRREKRIAKMPKKQHGTKKALKKERMLRRVLTNRSLSKILTHILNDEISSSKKKQQDQDTNIQRKDTSTFPTGYVEIPQIQSKENKEFPRILSANQIMTFAVEEEGPKKNQISRCIDTPQDLPIPIFKKDIFYIFAENNAEEEYRANLDYSNLLVLKTKPKLMESEEKLPCLNPANDISDTNYNKNKVSNCNIFDFSAYSRKVQHEANKLY